MRCAFRFWHREGLLTCNPMALVERPRKERHLIRPLSVEQAAQLIEQPDTATFAGVRDRAMMMLMMDSGLRVTEVLSLEAGRIDWMTGRRFAGRRPQAGRLGVSMTRRVTTAVAAILALAGAQPARAAGAPVLPDFGRTAQSYALGDAAAVLEGLGALGVNPAGMHVIRPELLVQYQQMPLETNLALVGLACPVRPLRTTLSLTYLGLRSAGFDKRDALGAPQGSFSQEDQIMGFYLSRPLAVEGFNPLYLGMGMKRLRTRIDGYGAQAAMFDVGARYAMWGLPLAFGASALNLGKGPILAAQDLSHRPNEGGDEFAVGMQYRAGGVLALRGRYALSREALEQGWGLDKLAGGIGLKLFGDQYLDYSFQPFDAGLRLRQHACGPVGDCYT